jgi:hypothetical protein
MQPQTFEVDIEYHHCADLQIAADPARPIDTGRPQAVRR